MTTIHKPEIVYSGNWAFRLVDPSTVLAKGEIAFKSTSYSKEFLDKFQIPPFDHTRAKKVKGDGRTALKDMHYSFATPNAIFYRPDLPLTEEYRYRLYLSTERDHVASDGASYYPAPLDCTPDLALALTSKREVISGANRYGSRLVRSTTRRQLNAVDSWAYYLRRDREPEWDQSLLDAVEDVPEEDDKTALIESLQNQIAELQSQLDRVLDS